MFAIELMLPEVSVRTCLPVAIATGAATFVGRRFFGQQPAFLVPGMEPLAADGDALVPLVLYGILGAITGIAAAGLGEAAAHPGGLPPALPHGLSVAT